MSQHIDEFLSYLLSVRRFSTRTVEIYRDVLNRYEGFSAGDISVNSIRAYEVHLLDEQKLSPRTVNQHLSVLGSYCTYLQRTGVLKNNPARLVKRPKQEKRLPVFYRSEEMEEYFESHRGVLEFGKYEAALRYMIVSILFATGMRRVELISLDRSSVDRARGVIRVHGKGDKIREIPMTRQLMSDLDCFLGRFGGDFTLSAPLLVTPSGDRIYPMYVDRAVKQELGGIAGITVRKSPHVLRHTLATELLNSGSDLNSIKELLGHSSLAATQVYTHNSIDRLRKVYEEAHPLAKK